MIYLSNPCFSLSFSSISPPPLYLVSLSFIHLVCITQLGILSSFFYVYFFFLLITNFFLFHYLLSFHIFLHFMPLSLSLSLFLSLSLSFITYSLSVFTFSLKKNPFILLQNLILSFSHFLFQPFFLFLSILTFCLLFFHSSSIFKLGFFLIHQAFIFFHFFQLSLLLFVFFAFVNLSTLISSLYQLQLMTYKSFISLGRQSKKEIKKTKKQTPNSNLCMCAVMPA